MGAETTIKDLLKMSREAGVERLPVITPDDTATALIDVLDVLLDKNPRRSLGDYVRRIIFADEDEPVYRVIQRLRAARLGLAAVMNKGQQLTGIVTAEDLIKHLVSSAA